MLHWKRRLLCSWITATLIWYIGSYMLLPIDFNGKLEIFLKHLKKKNFFFWFACVSDWTLIIFQVSLLSLKSCQLCFFKKKKKNFCSWTSTQITLKFFNMCHFFWSSHVLTCYFNFNQPSPWMNVMWVWILSNLEYAWLNFSYPHWNLFYFIWLHPHSNLI